MKKQFAFMLGCAVVLTLLLYVVWDWPDAPVEFTHARVTVDDVEFTVEVADSKREWDRGLQYRKILEPKTGMLFIFSESQRPTFWMKNTNIGLDFIWIRDGRVVEVTENVHPEPGVTDDQLKRYSPQSPVDAVLEVAEGSVEGYHIQIGDKVQISQ